MKLIRMWKPMSILVLLLVGCTGTAPAATPTAQAVVKMLATVEISATPNADEQAATRAASSPTPLPPTATIIPSETPYIGIFIGEAEQPEGFAVIDAPFFGDTSIAAQPTANANVCNIPIDAAFVPIWQETAVVRRRLGCPIQQGFGFFGSLQVFESGVMYFYPDFNAVWAILRSTQPQSPAEGRFEYLENPPQGSLTGVPTNPPLLLPDGVFADMWIAVPDLRSDIGYAISEVGEASMGLQRFDNGTFLYDATSEQVYALVIDGTVLGPYLPPQNAEPGTAPEITPEPFSTPSAEATAETQP